MPQAQRTLDAAMATTLDAATADMKQSHIAVVSSDSEDDGTTPLIGIRGHAQNRLVSTVAGHAGMHVPRGQHIQRQRNPPQALLVPARLVSLEAQQMLTCGTFGLLVCAAYTAVTFLLMALAGVSFTGLNA